MNKSFWIAGFECSCHRRSDGRRLDLLAATRHDHFALADYTRLRRMGIETARDGVRWHLVERSPGRYEFGSLLPMVRAAREAGVRVIWDLSHYGWPDGLDIFGPEFVDRFAEYARAVAKVIAQETDEPAAFCPINEVSFWSWAGGDVGYLNPFAVGRGFELKVQLVRASLAAIDAIWSVDPLARILHAEPAIHILPNPDPEARKDTEGHRLAQFQAFDMLAGRLWPQLGGDERYLDVVGVNYYPANQWLLDGPTVWRGDPRYRPFREILMEVWERYGRPVLVSETGDQGANRGPWLEYVSEEVRAARSAGVPVEGICLYPILDYPGWDDDRHCQTGLWSFAGPDGHRETCSDYALELERQFKMPAMPAIPAISDSQSPAADRAPDEETENAAF
ncbi:MAG TPA: beta-glucosidase [Thermoanaerobaculia bacterium]|nr:beta-glucosidase [Thermoanaerobaculia bacterium]